MRQVLARLTDWVSFQVMETGNRGFGFCCAE